MWQERQDGDIIQLRLVDQQSDAASSLAELADLIERQPEARWVVDFGGLGLATSASLALLMRSLRTLEETGGRIVACHAGDRLATSPRVIKATQWMPLFQDRDSARSHLASA